MEKKVNVKEQLRSMLFNRQRAYISVFDSEFGKYVKNDLGLFCREKESCFHEDPRIHAVIEGRREVILRINNHLEMDSETLWKFYSERGKIS